MRITHCARALVLASGVVFFAANVDAAAPRFNQIMPRGVQRGTEVTFTISGQNLEDAEELLLYDKGLEVVSLEQPKEDKDKGKVVTVKAKVAADCVIGTQRMRLRTRTGLTDLQNVYVGPLPIVDEKEPNTDPEKAQSIEQNITIQGRVDREDVDYYVVEAKQGQRLTAEVFGMRLGYSGGGNYFDPYVAFLKPDGTEISTVDDTALVFNDTVNSILVPEDGKYVIQLRDASYGGDGRAVYLMSVGTFPRPLATIPSGGKPGEKLTVTFVGDVKGPITREITLPAEEPERFAVEVQDESGFAPSAMPFRVSDLNGFMEQEPNNDRTTASAAEAPGALHGVVSAPGDVDYFKFGAKKDQSVEVRVYARSVRSPLDAVTNVYRADNGQRVEGNDDGRNLDSFFRFKAPADGDYVVAIQDQLKRGGENFTYRIEMTSNQPSLRVEPIEFSRYVQPIMEIPQGSGRGFSLTIRRGDFDGPINLRGDDLPAGVRLECPEGWRTTGQMPVVFFANEDAPLSGKWSKVTAYLDDPKQADRKVEAPIVQDILMIRGQNNNRVWEERLSKVAMVVTEKLPVKVWLETPKVPVVRGGPMNLIVKCEKQEGWDEEIQVLLLQNPSGVNSSTSSKIPKGQTETTIQLNAAGNAPTGESMIAARCITKVGNGNIECCTPFVPLRVEEQYVTFEFAQTAVEQGKETPFVITVKKRKDFEGEAEVKLFGLPTNSTAEPLKVTKDSTELVFTIKAAENTPTGLSKNVFGQLLVPEAGDLITHNLGNGVLRVDPPAPPKKNASADVAKKDAAPKPVSRLEQLRQQQKEKEAAGGSGGSQK